MPEPEETVDESPSVRGKRKMPEPEETVDESPDLMIPCCDRLQQGIIRSGYSNVKNRAYRYENTWKARNSLQMRKELLRSLKVKTKVSGPTEIVKLRRLIYQ